MTPEVGQIVRLVRHPERYVGLIVRIDGAKVDVLMSPTHKLMTTTESVELEPLASVPADAGVQLILEREAKALEGVPARLHRPLKKVWYSGSLAGRDRHKKEKGRDTTGVAAQKENALILREAGIDLKDPRYERVRAFGAWLYGLSPSSARPPAKPAAAATEAPAEPALSVAAE